MALPADDASEIALFILNPAAGRDAEAYATLAAPSGTKPTGMCMCVDFHWIKRGAFVRAQQRDKESDLPTRLDNVCGSRSGGDEGGDGNTCWLDDHILVLIAGYEDGTIIVWDVASLSAVHRSPRHSEPMLCIAADGKRDLLAVSGSAGTTLTVGPVWPALAGAKANARAQQITLKHPGINAAVHRDDFKLLATAGWDNRVRLFSWPKMNALAILESHTSAINCLVWSRPLPSLGWIRLLAACSKDSRISLWSMYND